MSAELKFTGNIRRLRLRPGDKIIVELPEGVRLDDALEFREQLGPLFPENEVLLCGNGVRIVGVLRPDAAALAETVRAEFVKMARNGSKLGFSGA